MVLNEVQSKPDLHPRLLNKHQMAFHPARKIKTGDKNRETEETHPDAGACVWVGLQSFPNSLSSDVCASVMEMQIKLYVSVMTDETAEAPQKNPSMILKLDSKLPKHRGGGYKSSCSGYAAATGAR